MGERELFVPFKEFPCFRDASVREIANVELPSPHHLRGRISTSTLPLNQSSTREVPVS